MRFGMGIVLVAFTVASIVGCGNQGSNAPQASVNATPAKTDAQAATKQVRPQGDGPDAVTYDFLESIRTGNDEKAAKLLTPLAREKVAEHNMAVSPPGTDTAKFELGAVQMLSDDGARVVTKWVDVDDDGNATCADEVIWMLRKVSEGWRIAGVSAPVFDNEPPLLLNFEDPEDMLRKQELVREEMERRANPQPEQPQQAQQPATPAVAPPAQAQQTDKPDSPVMR